MQIEKQHFFVYKLHTFLLFQHLMFNSVNIFSVFSKGQTETLLYRFLVKGGGYVWMKTQATVRVRQTLTETAVRHVRQLRRQVSNILRFVHTYRHRNSAR